MNFKMAIGLTFDLDRCRRSGEGRMQSSTIRLDCNSPRVNTLRSDCLEVTPTRDSDQKSKLNTRDAGMASLVVPISC